MKPENMEKAIELNEEIKAVRWAREHCNTNSIWIAIKLRKRFRSLLDEHERELIEEVNKL